MLKNINIFVFVVLILSFFNPVSAEENISPKNPTEKNLLLIQKLLVDLSHQKLNTGLAAIHSLSSLEFETADFFVDLVMRELTGRQNKFILEALMHELAQKSHRRQMFDDEGLVRADSKILELQIKLNSVLTKEKKFERVRGNLLRLMQKSVDRAKIYKNSQPELLSTPLTLASYEFALNKMNPLEEGKVTPPRLSNPNYSFYKNELLKISPRQRGLGGKKEVKAGDSSPVDIVLAGTVDIVTDRIALSIINDTLPKVIGRRNVLNNVLLTLSRYKQQNVVLLGSKGSGKTSIVDLLAEAIVTGVVEESEVTAFLKDAVILQTSSGRISRLAKSDKPAGQADAMESFFTAVSEVQKLIHRRVIVFIDELHTLTPDQVEVIKPFIESDSSQIMLIGASTSPEYRARFKHNDAFGSRMQPTAVSEQSLEEVLIIFKESWMKTLSRRHPGLSIDQDLMELMIRKSALIYPDKGVLRGTFVLADDLANWIRMNQPDRKPLELSESDLYQFLKLQLGLPADPTQFAELLEYRNTLIEKIKKNIFGQDRMINDLVDLWMSVLKNQSRRGIRVGLVLGRSGTGKTETALQLALEALGSKERHIIIKCSDFADADDIKLSTIFGVPGGVNFGKTSAGTLMDWLDDPTKGKNGGIIQLDEWHEANELFRNRFLEVFDTSSVEGGDGKIRYLNHHLVIITTNHGDSVLFPPESVTWTKQQADDRLNSFDDEDLRVLAEKQIGEKKSHISNTLANRIDLFTASNLITKDVATDISMKFFRMLENEYKKLSKVNIHIDPLVADVFIEIINPMNRGARPLVRAIDQYVKKAIEFALAHPHKKGDAFKVTIGADEGQKPAFMIYHNQHQEAYFSNLPHIKPENYKNFTFLNNQCRSLF